MSTYFDPNDKKNKPILDYFADKIWLVIENATSSRGSIRKTLNQIGVKGANILDAGSVEEAKSVIESKKPHFILTNKEVKDGNTLPLFGLHLKAKPNRLESGFYVISEESSLSEVAWVLEYEMDGIISLPFNAAILIQTIVSGIIRKINPSEYLTQIELGRDHYLKSELDKSIEIFKAAAGLDSKPYEAEAFLGQIYLEQNLIPEALTSLETAVKHNPKYFKSIYKLANLYYQQKDYKKS
jgi:tetratricopeptide (TPR) repeat protein